MGQDTRARLASLAAKYARVFAISFDDVCKREFLNADDSENGEVYARNDSTLPRWTLRPEGLGGQ